MKSLIQSQKSFVATATVVEQENLPALQEVQEDSSEEEKVDICLNKTSILDKQESEGSDISNHSVLSGIQDDDELDLDQNRGGRKQSTYKSRLERIQIAKMNQSVEV